MKLSVLYPVVRCPEDGPWLWCVATHHSAISRAADPGPPPPEPEPGTGYRHKNILQLSKIFQYIQNVRIFRICCYLGSGVISDIPAPGWWWPPPVPAADGRRAAASAGIIETLARSLYKLCKVIKTCVKRAKVSC